MHAYPKSISTFLLSYLADYQDTKHLVPFCSQFEKIDSTNNYPECVMEKTFLKGGDSQDQCILNTVPQFHQIVSDSITFPREGITKLCFPAMEIF